MKRLSRAHRARHGGGGQPSRTEVGRAKLLEQIKKAKEAGDTELARELRALGEDGGWLEKPSPNESLNREIRRAAGRE